MSRGRKEREPEIPEMGKIPIGSILRARRMFIGLSLSEMASFSNFRSTTISVVENNHNIPSDSFVSKMSYILGIKDITSVSREDVIGWIQERKERQEREKRMITESVVPTKIVGEFQLSDGINNFIIRIKDGEIIALDGFSIEKSLAFLRSRQVK